MIFDEPEADAVAARLRGAQLVAPALLTYEIVNVCTTRLRRNPAKRAAILDAFNAYQSLVLDLTDIDPSGVLELAEQSALTGYDASYLWLAQRLQAELVTLDGPLARAATALGRR